MNKPQPQILTIWRITLALAAVVPALALSLLLRVGSPEWLFASGGLALVFLAAYLVYLPTLYNRTTFGVSDGKLILRTGVLTDRVTSMPLSRIQFVAVARPILTRVFGLASVIAVASGGSVVLRGLKADDAERLALLLSPDREGDEEG